MVSRYEDQAEPNYETHVHYAQISLVLASPPLGYAIHVYVYHVALVLFHLSYLVDIDTLSLRYT